MEIIEYDLEAQIDALLSGSDQPVEIEPYDVDDDDDFAVMAPPQSLPVVEAGVIEVEATPEGIEAGAIELDEDDLLLAVVEEAPSPAPKKVERLDRVSAWNDCVAEERARDLLGSDVLDPIVEQMGSAPKKVADKVYNVLCHLGDRSRLSNFTELTLKALSEHAELTPGGLAALFEQGGYTAATAKSQASQQMKAMSILGLASYQDGWLRYSPDSPVLAILLEKHKNLAVQAPSPAPESDDSDEELLLAGEPESDEESLLDT